MKIWVLLGLLLTVSATTFAAETEDDLLSILNSEAGDSIVKERDDLTDAIRTQLKTTTAQQETLLNLVTESKYKEALFQWQAAFSGTAFGKSPSGQAFKAFLLYQTGAPLNGIRNLFAVEEPQRILPEIKKIWNLSLSSESNIWPKLRLSWSPAWTEFFGAEVQAKVVSWQVYDPTDTKKILSLISNTKLNTPERHWLEWQMALGLALQDDSTKAGKVLAHMLQSDQKVISHDLIYITAARLLYEKGFLTPAISYYRKVPKKSEYWFEAQEEIAWSYIRKGEPQNTLAVTQSLVLPVFAPYIGPEAQFLRAFGQLKVCDYPEVIKAVRAFKAQFKPRMQNLMALTANVDSPAVEEFISLAKKGRVNPLDLKERALYLPRFLTRDEVAYINIEQLAQLEKEVQVIDGFSQQAIKDNNTLAQGQFEELRKQTEARMTESRNSINERIQMLSQNEIEEIKSVLKKMHIIEAEVIQQVSIAKKVDDSKAKPAFVSGTTGSESKYSLKFPYENEVWFDEIGSYKVDVRKNCLALAQ